MTVLAAIDIDHTPEEVVSTAHELATAFNDRLLIIYVMPQEKYKQRQRSDDEVQGGATPSRTPDPQDGSGNGISNFSVGGSRTEGSDSKPASPEQKFTREKAIDSAANQASQVANRVLGTLENVEAIGRVGTPEEEILEVIENKDPRFVVIGGRKRSPTKQAIFGSVSHTVIQKSEPPVMALMNSSE